MKVAKLAILTFMGRAGENEEKTSPPLKVETANAFTLQSWERIIQSEQQILPVWPGPQCGVVWSPCQASLYQSHSQSTTFEHWPGGFIGDGRTKIFAPHTCWPRDKHSHHHSCVLGLEANVSRSICWTSVPRLLLLAKREIFTPVPVSPVPVQKCWENATCGCGGETDLIISPGLDPPQGYERESSISQGTKHPTMHRHSAKASHQSRSVSHGHRRWRGGLWGIFHQQINLCQETEVENKWHSFSIGLTQQRPKQWPFVAADAIHACSRGSLIIHT